MRFNLPRAFALLALAACFLGCQPQHSFTATDITGATLGKAGWQLSDATGKLRNAQDNQKITAVFFGFTRCPDVCPTTLVDYVAALKLMGDKAAKVQVFFITLDPVRDTFPALQQYTQAFHPSFVALRGDESATKAAADAYKVFYAKNMGADKNPLNYTLDHTAASYVHDQQGNIRLYVRHGQSAESLAKDLGALIQ